MNVSYDYHRDRARFTKKTVAPRVAPAAKPQHPPRKEKLPRLRKERRGILKPLLIIFFSFAVLGVFALIAVVGWYSRDLPDPNRLIERNLPQSTRIYDRTGEVLLFQFHGDQQRTLVALDDIPDAVKWATIVAEDKNFYTHKGIDLAGILRALIIDLLRGGKVQGGSTITQQLIKNALLSNEKSLSRKAKEAILSYRIERSFSKNEILQLYLNEIPYGSTAYGISAAARMYFDKDVSDLNVAESTVLAVLPKAPTYYSPWGNNRDKLIARQQMVLDQMAQEGYITEEEARLAKEEKLTFHEQTNSIRAPHFVMMVREQLSELFGDKLVDEGGLTVITTLDYEKQKIAEEAVRASAEKNVGLGATNAALVSLDARTGEILALVGSKDYFNEEIDGNVNVVLRPRQPGSSFKPIVYATAFQRGFTPDTIVFDLETNFDTTGEKPYSPKNYTGKEYGSVTMKKALAGSLNIAAVKTLYLAGVSNVLDLAEDLGYTTLRDRSRFGLSLVLGGGEVTLLEHTAAFTAFAQESVRAKPASILSVRNDGGKTLHEFQKKTVQTKLDKEVARSINAILSNQGERAYVFGGNTAFVLPGREAAAKTGTTNDYRDAWLIGYTPSIVTGVWVGNNDNSEMKGGADGSVVAAPIWNAYMRAVLSGVAAEGFTRPAPIITNKPVLDGSRGSGTIHDTLFYVNRDDPRGSPPENPGQDPQFSEWERVVRAWVARENIQETPDQIPPQEPPQTSAYDDAENSIALSITSPQENEAITTPLLRTTVDVSSPHGINTVAYYLDTKELGTISEPPYSLFATLGGVDNGFRTLRVVATDTQGHTREARMTVNILLP